MDYAGTAWPHTSDWNKTLNPMLDVIATLFLLGMMYILPAALLALFRGIHKAFEDDHKDK